MPELYNPQANTALRLRQRVLDLLGTSLQHAGTAASAAGQPRVRRLTPEGVPQEQPSYLGRALGALPGMVLPGDPSDPTLGMLPPVGNVVSKPFYNKVLRVLEDPKTPAKMPLSQWMRFLTNKGVKDAEVAPLLEASGLWASKAEESVPRETIHKFLFDALPDVRVVPVRGPKYGEYTLPGKPNYYEEQVFKTKQAYESPHYTGLREGMQDYRELSDKSSARGSGYLLHTRRTARPVVGEAKPALVLEELQSDLAAAMHGKKEPWTEQELANVWELRGHIRREQYNIDKQISDIRSRDRLAGGLTPENTNLVERLSFKLEDLATKEITLSEILQARTSLAGLNPRSVPLMKDWPALGVKQTLGDAAKRGYDRVAWTPAKVQGKRWGGKEHAALYDERIPGLMKKLTGQPVEMVEVGAPEVKLDNATTWNDVETAMSSKKLTAAERTFLGNMAARGLIAPWQQFGRGRRFVANEKINLLLRKAGLKTTISQRNIKELPSVRLTPEVRRKILEEGFPVY